MQNSRVYKLSGWRRWVSVFGFVFFCLMTAMCWAIGRSLGISAMIFMSAFFGFATLFTTVLAVNAFKTAVILSADRIEIRRLWGSKTLSFGQIRGLSKSSYRIPSEVDTPAILLFKIEPIDDRLPAVEIDDVFGFDETFYQWLRGLPDLGTTPRRS
jgi:hypothetical protein